MLAARRRQLEELLYAHPYVNTIAHQVRQQALGLFRGLPEEQLAALGALPQLALARLLQSEKETDLALHSYQRMLAAYPHFMTAAEAGLEAARLACQHNRFEQARSFLKAVLAKKLSREFRRAAEQLLRSVQAASAEVLDVLPLTEAVGTQAVAELPQAAQPSTAAAGPVAGSTAKRRSLGQLLVAFMEERNILWGELIGGILIVGFAIPLVVSLWDRLKQIPLFPFLIFAGITATICGAGHYTLRRWKLQLTSRGLLVIASLLVPLNFLVLAGLTRSDPGWFALIVGVVSVAGFIGLMYPTARVLSPQASTLLSVAVLGPSASQLLVPWFSAFQSVPFWHLTMLGLLPVACQSVAITGALWKAKHQSFKEAQAKNFFVLLGQAAFANAVALGFLIYWSGGHSPALQQIAVLLALASVPYLLAGLFIERGLEEDGGQAAEPVDVAESFIPATTSAIIRTAGSTVAVAAIFGMLSAVILAWPQPEAIIAVCCIDALILTAVALHCQLPIAHIVALPCLATAYLTALHLLAGNLTEPYEQAFMSNAGTTTTAVALAILAVVLALVSESCAAHQVRNPCLAVRPFRRHRGRDRFADSDVARQPGAAANDSCLRALRQHGPGNEPALATALAELCRFDADPGVPGSLRWVVCSRDFSAKALVARSARSRHAFLGSQSCREVWQTFAFACASGSCGADLRDAVSVVGATFHVPGRAPSVRDGTWEDGVAVGVHVLVGGSVVGDCLHRSLAGSPVRLPDCFECGRRSRRYRLA